MATPFLGSDRSWMETCAGCGVRLKNGTRDTDGEPRVHRMTTQGRKAYHLNHQPDEGEIAQ